MIERITWRRNIYAQYFYLFWVKLRIPKQEWYVTHELKLGDHTSDQEERISLLLESRPPSATLAQKLFLSLLNIIIHLFSLIHYKNMPIYQILKQYFLLTLHFQLPIPLFICFLSQSSVWNKIYKSPKVYNLPSKISLTHNQM
jgi:hypothetical protein